MHWDAPTSTFLGDHVANMNCVGHAALSIENHRPVEAGDLAGAQARFDRKQDHDAVSKGEGCF
jgi:hypothetical protein